MKKNLLFILFLFSFYSIKVADGDPISLIDDTDLDTDSGGDDDSNNNQDSGHYTSSAVDTIHDNQEGVLQHHSNRSVVDHSEQPSIRSDGSDIITTGNTNIISPIDTTQEDHIFNTSQQQYIDKQVANLMNQLQLGSDMFEVRMIQAKLTSEASSDQLDKAFENYFENNLKNKTPQERSRFMAEITDSINMANNMSTAILDALQAAQATAQKNYSVNKKPVKNKNNRSTVKGSTKNSALMKKKRRINK